MFIRNVIYLYTLGLWANSIWVGVPGLRETACDCCIVGSFIGETDRSLLQGSNHTHRYKVHFREGSFSACRQTRVYCDLCVCMYVCCQVIRARWRVRREKTLWYVQERGKKRKKNGRNREKEYID